MDAGIVLWVVGAQLSTGMHNPADWSTQSNKKLDLKPYNSSLLTYRILYDMSTVTPAKDRSTPQRETPIAQM